MENEQHLRIITEGSDVWNRWRERYPRLEVDLSDADLRKVHLAGANLAGVDLNHADLSGTDLSGASLVDANLIGALLFYANLSSAKLDRADFTVATLRGANLNSARAINTNFSGADFRGASCVEANFSSSTLTQADLNHANLNSAEFDGANLRRASLRFSQLVGADLTSANLSNADLTGADLSQSQLYDTNLSSATLNETMMQETQLWNTVLGGNDLSTVKGLATVKHRGPSTVGIDTLFMTGDGIPDLFLRGAGVPDDFITYVPSLVGSGIEFYSSFISYSQKDVEFSERLYSRMRGENLRVWYASEDVKGGRKLHEQIFRAIQLHDKLLLVLSANSMTSEWVMTEIRRALRIEREERRRKLFPIRLVDFEVLQEWECFDADSGKDLAIEVREYYIPDFSNWRDEEAFQVEFAKLLRDLKPTSY
jgi:uncharacterized protein YjbI with pentapeptide repeats